MKIKEDQPPIETVLQQCGDESMEWVRMWPQGQPPVILVRNARDGQVTQINLRDWPQFFEAIPHESGTAFHFTAAARDRYLKMSRPV